jgi:hypothetical protein
MEEVESLKVGIDSCPIGSSMLGDEKIFNE